MIFKAISAAILVLSLCKFSSATAANATVGQLTTFKVRAASSAGFEAGLETSLPPVIKAEPGTRSEFGAKVVSGLTNDTAPTNVAEYIIYGTFVDEEARAADVVDISSKIHTLSATQNFNILANKIGTTSLPANQFGLLVTFAAINESSIPAVRSFLVGAKPLVDAEPGTTNWIAIQFGTSKYFGIIDSSPTDDARTAHLNGPVAAALFANVGVILEGTPVINKTTIVVAGGDQ